MEVNAYFEVNTKTIKVEQQLQYKNEGHQPLQVIYLQDWNNSYSTKNTPLAKRFTEEFDSKFHFARKGERGYTNIEIITNASLESLDFEYLPDHPDIIKVFLAEIINPGEFYTLNLSYDLIIPNDEFTSFGFTEDSNFKLKYWYIVPAVFDGTWHYFSNKNIYDLYTPKTDIVLKLEFPRNYIAISELNLVGTELTTRGQKMTFSGKDRINTDLYLQRQANFKFIQTDNFTVLTDISDKKVMPMQTALITDCITSFLTNNLGTYPHEQMLLTSIDYKHEPLYGLNQLPNFLSPFSDGFEFELKLLKTALKRYVENSLLFNPREDNWLSDGIQIFYMMKYMETYYPDLKLIGKWADFWGIKAFHAADLLFNEQFNLFFMQMARTNRDQPLTTAKDSLLKFNARIANKYKAGVGLRYLDDFVNSDVVEKSIRKLMDENRLELTKSEKFEEIIQESTEKDVNWFFGDYINSRKKIDYKIKSLETLEDSIAITIRNKRKSNMPISLFTLQNDNVIAKRWIEDVGKEKTITIPKENGDKFALNYDQTIPEFNLRDNWKSKKGFFFNHRPLQIRLFKDFEDPNYNQVFLMPMLEFRNIYDGITIGAKFYNKTILRKKFNYKFAPQFGTKSKILTGGGSVSFTHNIEDRDLYNITYGFGGSYRSYGRDAFVRVLTPSVSFLFRNEYDFRSNESKYLNFRYLSIDRHLGDNAQITLTEPNYSVFNLRYINSNKGLIKYKSWFSDLQFGPKFGKLSFNYEFRHLSQTNRLFSFRTFAGLFLYNKTNPESNYFSFALDRPTDYLFDYNYLGRSESSGIFSQQLIIAEGGFKSVLEESFANQWMTTVNLGYTIWNIIEAYGDVGFLKNKDSSARFVYDSGIRLNLVADYFEVYFPVYSNLGWEIAQPNYDQKIRFVFTVDPQALLGLFRRRWY
ncbi:metalloprotease [Aegicerativicinus sediminis]